MGYICAQNNTDSLALIFYERATEDFQESGNEWRYAQSLLNISYRLINLQLFTTADSLLQTAYTYQLDSNYQARCYEIRGLYFYAQQQYDSALVYFKNGSDYWQSESEKCFGYLKIMQAYFNTNLMDSTLHYANKIITISNNPNYVSNAYYCLMQDANSRRDVKLLSQYSHARADAQKLLRKYMRQDAEALPILKEYLQNPHPFRWMWIIVCTSVALCVILIIGIIIYRKRSVARIHLSDQQIVSLSVQLLEQQDELQKQNKLYHYDKRLKSIRRKYPKPLNRWNDYAKLKKDIQPYLQILFGALDRFGLTNREKVFCALSFIYPQMAMEDLANCLCVTKGTLIVRKNNIAKKFGVSSAELSDFLQNLVNNE